MLITKFFRRIFSRARPVPAAVPPPPIKEEPEWIRSLNQLDREQRQRVDRINELVEQRKRDFVLAQGGRILNDERSRNGHRRKES